ncbi:MAG: YebC/PmpR family DNA-binding transcriptional regulator [Anaerolineae bacterium]|jgi:YebC/PmpR family DNA-binding regulatory protein|nr:YebC/PmpR family DNA-binding transcriptional regulator [Anaerolineae bacterium]
MSGHSKWSTIKRAKGAEDAKRGKIFTRVARDIMIAVRESGGEEASNPKLKIAIQKAKAANMPKDNIERAIKRGLGELGDGVQMEEITYEGYGPDGIAFLIDVLTDNKNRSVADIKRVFNRAGGSLASAGSVAWQFTQKGYLRVKPDGVDFDALFMTAADAGADDVTDEDGAFAVYTPRELLAPVENALTAAGYSVLESELFWQPNTETEVAIPSAVSNLKLQEALEELDDVQSVASNLSVTDDALAALETA